MQNDFCSPGGAVDLLGLDISAVRRTIEPVSRVLSAARGAGVRVIYLQHGYRPDLSDLGPTHSKNFLVHTTVGTTVPTPDGGTGRVLVRDTWNTEIIPELAVQPEDIVIGKNRFSGFFNTTLDATLRDLDVQNLVVTGVTTSVCVESTIRDAMFRDYVPVLLADCTAEPQGQANHDASLALIESTLGWVSDSADLLAALADTAQPTNTQPGSTQPADTQSANTQSGSTQPANA